MEISLNRSFVSVLSILFFLIVLLPDVILCQQIDGTEKKLQFELVTAESPHLQQKGMIKLKIHPASYDKLWHAGSAKIVNFPIPEFETVDIYVTENNVIAAEAVFMISDKRGIHEHPGPSMRFFQGYIAEDPDSLVSLNLFQGRIGGFIYYYGEEYSFGPSDFELSREGAYDITIRSERLAENGPKGFCDGELLPDPPITPLRETKALQDLLATESSKKSGMKIDENTLLKGFVAIEGTVEWVTHHGSVSAAETYTLNLLAQISAYYETDVKIKLEVPYSLMNASENDQYTNGEQNTAVLLPEMRTKWRNSSALRSVFRTCAHLFSHRPSGGGSGRAYLDVLCQGVNNPTSASDFGVSIIDGQGNSWEKRMVGHEIGHNFSSPHTHCYVPEIDQCENSESGCYSGPEVQITGTMMSYCNTRVSIIHPRVRDERIRPAAEAAFPACIDTAGEPGDIRVGDGSGLVISRPTICGSESFQLDDGSYNSAYGYYGTARANWVNRFTPACYPFKVTSVDMLTWHSSVTNNRDVRITISVDPSGGGSPLNASLVYTEDRIIPSPGSSWNHYVLSTPVIITSGDLYIGFYDLLADQADTYIMAYDTSSSGFSYYQSNSTDPTGLSYFTYGTFMIRAAGTGVDDDSILLSWGVPCNDGTVPDQDYAVYQGTFADFTSYVSLTCSTGRDRSFLIESPPDQSYWIIVPATSAVEGSYGLTSSNLERPPAALPCKSQGIGPCP